MFTDNTLTPKEAVRLCALGILAGSPRTYGDLATDVRHFVSHIIGPSLDVMGQSIELLKYEGLVTAADDNDAPADALLAITDAGREEFHTLLTANLRHGATELNKLIVALKFRFLDMLGPRDRQRQIDSLTDMFENEIDRLRTLKDHHVSDSGVLGEWLEREIERVSAQLAWLDHVRERIGD